MSLTLLGDRYELGLLVGQGGMADVFRATDTVLDRTVAVKVFRGGSSDADRVRFLAECQLTARLHHPNLVSVFDAGTDNGRDYLVMRLIEGKTLADKLDWGALEPEWVCRTGAVVAEALAYVHAGDVVHRDVKPSNILLGRGEVPFLADFGIALPSGAKRLTRSGQFLGTVAYTAPEQIHGEQATPAADVYALGLVLLEAMTGRVEFDGPESVAAIAKLNRAPSVPDSLPPKAAEIVSGMLATDPAQRLTAVACAELLHDAANYLLAHPEAPADSTRATEKIALVAKPAGSAKAPPAPPADQVKTEPLGHRRRMRPTYLIIAGAAVTASVLLFPAGLLDATSPRKAEGKTVPSTTSAPPPTSTQPVPTSAVAVPIDGSAPVRPPAPLPVQPKDGGGAEKSPDEAKPEDKAKKGNDKPPPHNGGGGGKKPEPGEKGPPKREG